MNELTITELKELTTSLRERLEEMVRYTEKYPECGISQEAINRISEVHKAILSKVK